MPDDRRAFGWGDEDFAPVEVVDSSDPSVFSVLLARTGDRHVLTGFLHNPVITSAFHALSKSGAPVFLQSESVDFHGFAGGLRMIRDRHKAARHRTRVRGVFAIGSHAVRYFSRLGFPSDQIVPFGYFVSAPITDADDPVDGKSFRIVFAGQFIRRKGVDILLAALGCLADLEWNLELIGSGAAEDALRAQAARLGLEGRITWKGVVAPDKIHARLAGADVLVLPSRWDGWGVVVNEALAAGVPVVCSDRCGAACVLTDDTVGEVFRACDSDALASILRRRIAEDRISRATRDACRTAASALTPEAGARQFLDGIAAVNSGSLPPPAPWLKATV